MTDQPYGLTSTNRGTTVQSTDPGDPPSARISTRSIRTTMMPTRMLSTKWPTMVLGPSSIQVEHWLCCRSNWAELWTHTYGSGGCRICGWLATVSFQSYQPLIYRHWYTWYMEWRRRYDIDWSLISRIHAEQFTRGSRYHQG